MIERHADERQFLPILPAGRSIQEQRLAARLGHHDRLAAFDDAAGDALAQPVAGALPIDGQPAGRLDVQLTGLLVEQRDRAANDAMMALEDLERLWQRNVEVERGRDGLTDVDERRETADLFRRAARIVGVERSRIAANGARFPQFRRSAAWLTTGL